MKLDARFRLAEADPWRSRPRPLPEGMTAAPSRGRGFAKLRAAWRKADPEAPRLFRQFVNEQVDVFSPSTRAAEFAQVIVGLFEKERTSAAPGTPPELD